MIIVGIPFNNLFRTTHTFLQIYGIFDNEDAYIQWKSIIPAIEYIIAVTLPNFHFPILIINEPSYYKIMDEKSLEMYIAQLNLSSNDDEYIYFNLFIIKKNTYNENFPNESILRGRDYHIHMTERDVAEIKALGAKVYLQEHIKSLDIKNINL